VHIPFYTWTNDLSRYIKLAAKCCLEKLPYDTQYNN
jgi:hypothetical protein